MNISIKLTLFLFLCLFLSLQAHADEVITLPSGSEYDLIGFSHLVNFADGAVVMVVKYMSSVPDLKNIPVMRRESDELAKAFFKMASEKGYSYLIIRAYGKKPKDTRAPWYYYNFLYEKKEGVWSKAQAK